MHLPIDAELPGKKWGHQAVRLMDEDTTLSQHLDYVVDPTLDNSAVMVTYTCLAIRPNFGR